MRHIPICFLALLAGATPAPSFQEDAATERLLRVVERLDRQTPDPTDARAAAARLGFDRAKILEYVAGLSWEPYVGILRDAGGTQMCGGGNSLDRSLLLKAMLEAGGEKVRLMRSDLDEAEGARLLESFRKRDPRTRLVRGERDLKSLAEGLGTDLRVLEALSLDRRRRDASFVEEILDAARPEAARLRELIGAREAAALPVPREHYWLQVLDPQKQTWADLDPTPVELQKKTARPVTPQDLASQRRSVSFKLVLHRRSGEKVEQVPLLATSFDLGSLAWRPIDLVMQPSEGQLPDTGKHDRPDAKAQLESILKVKVYRAGLIVDGKPYGAAPFDLDGKVYEVDSGGRTGPAKMIGKAVGGAFGGLGAGLGGEGKKGEATKLERLVLEIGIKEPGAKELIHARDLLGPLRPGEQFRAMPILHASFLVSPALLPPGERERRELAMLARNAGALRKLLNGNLEGIQLNQHVEVSSLLLRFDDFRRRVLARLLAGAGFVQDRVTLCASTRQLFVDEAQGEGRVRRGIDILENPLLVVSADGKPDPNAAMVMGVADTALECLLVGRIAPAETGLSAWTFLERARLTGGKAQVVGGLGGRIELRWSEAASWSVDPATGNTVGRLPGGAGQGMTEYAWEQRERICGVSDLLNNFLGTQKGGKEMVEEGAGRQAGDLLSKGCSAIGGKNATDYMKDKIIEMNREFWAAATDALAGGGE
jgi:hypothetical protein